MTLRQEFFKELKEAQSFMLLSVQEQQELLASYEDADDAVFKRGLEVILAVEAKFQAKLKQIGDDQTKLAHAIKLTLQRLAATALRENELKDQQFTAGVLADLQKQIDIL